METDIAETSFMDNAPSISTPPTPRVHCVLLILSSLYFLSVVSEHPLQSCCLDLPSHTLLGWYGLKGPIGTGAHRGLKHD